MHFSMYLLQSGTDGISEV